MRIVLGSDHAGFKLKESIKKHLGEKGILFDDFGVDSAEIADYPDIAVNVARAVASHKYDKGILICGTGVGMSIAANKISGIRAALCYSPKIARLSRSHNDANILTLGGRFTGEDEAEQIVKVFLETEFEAGGRHERRVNKISDIPNE